MSNILYYISNAGIAILSLITGYLVIIALMALIGFLPKNMDSTFELPIELENMESFYLAKDMDNRFKSTHIEVKRANLEILPENRSWPQSLGYFGAAIYLGLFIGILVMLSKLLHTFRTGRPFASGNTNHFRWIGFLTIGLAIYKMVIETLVAQIFHSKFTIANASIPSMPTFWEIDFIALFLGMVFLALSTVFKTGTDLQELEDLTV